MIKKRDTQILERYLAKMDLIRQSNHVKMGETAKERQARIERAKKDYKFCFEYYFPHYATSACADFQIDAANFIKKNPNCIDVEAWARAHAKSTHLIIGINFWQWLNDCLDVTILVGKSEDDAITLLSDLQAEFEANPQIIADFGEQKTPGAWEAGRFVTRSKEVAFFALGRGQSPRGLRYKQKRPTKIIISDIDDDEIVNNQKRVSKVVKWIFGALLGATDNRGAQLIFDNNYWSATGILSQVIKRVEALKKTEKNVRVKFVNALDEHGNPTWKEKYNKEYFEEKRRIMGDFNFQSEYMNNPQVEGKIFLEEQIQWAKLMPLSKFECIVGHWDVAYAGTETGDYNAVKIWGLKDGKFYCIKAFVRQCKMAVAMRWMIDYELSLPSNVKVHWRFESQFWNDALKMTLEEINSNLRATQNDEPYQLRLVQTERPRTNKFDRILSLQPYYQNGRIYYNIQEQFNLDMQAGINQLKAIEPGYNTHDDSPDADEGAISFLSKFIPSNNFMPIVGDRRDSASAW